MFSQTLIIHSLSEIIPMSKLGKDGRLAYWNLIFCKGTVGTITSFAQAVPLNLSEGML